MDMLGKVRRMKMRDKLSITVIRIDGTIGTRTL
jgi:hypothetical protein